MDINFELYKVFYHVARTLSFSEAAERLFISQSAVSQSIRQLETKLGCLLFYRSTKKVRLTSEGQALFSHIAQAYNFISSGERTVIQMNSLRQGEIKLASTDTICKYFLLPYIKIFNEKYPQIKLNITNRTSPLCLDLLRNGSVDFAVINIPRNIDDKNFEIQVKKQVHDIFVTGNKFKRLTYEPVSLWEICRYPLLVLEQNTVTRDYFDQLLSDHALKVKPDVELGSVELLLEMTKIGLGIAFVPSDCVKQSQSDLYPIHLKEPTVQRGLGIVTLKNLPLSNASQKFIEVLSEQ